MPLSWRLFSKLSELTEKWGTSENELLQWGAAGRMKISACVDIIEKPSDPFDILLGFDSRKKMFVAINSNDLIHFAIGDNEIFLSSLYDDKRNVVENYRWEGNDFGYLLSKSTSIYRKNLVVLAAEVTRMESEYPELLAAGTPAGSTVAAESGQNDTPSLPSRVVSEISPRKNTKVQSKTGGRPKEQLAEAIEIAYLHFQATGNVEILKPGNIKFFLKKINEIVKKEIPLAELGNQKIANDICEHIKDVKIPRAGKCYVTTHDRCEGSKTYHGDRYAQDAVSKLLTALRKQYPIIS